MWFISKGYCHDLKLFRQQYKSGVIKALALNTGKYGKKKALGNHEHSLLNGTKILVYD